jgi:hypothetical protein
MSSQDLKELNDIKIKCGKSNKSGEGVDSTNFFCVAILRLWQKFNQPPHPEPKTP